MRKRVRGGEQEPARKATTMSFKTNFMNIGRKAGLLSIALTSFIALLAITAKADILPAAYDVSDSYYLNSTLTLNSGNYVPAGPGTSAHFPDACCPRQPERLAPLPLPLWVIWGARHQCTTPVSPRSPPSTKARMESNGFGMW